MDDLIPIVDTPPLHNYTIRLHGSVRGKTVASLCHAYALTEIKLSLPGAVTNAPWRTTRKPQDYFAWRKALVIERNEIRLTLVDLFNGTPIEVGMPKWPLVNGVAAYNPDLATSISQEYARACVKALGLTDGK